MVIRVTPQQGRGTFFWSLPKTNDYQTISSVVIPKKANTLNDVYNNTLISYAPSGSEKISFSFIAKPVSKTISSSFTLEDYNKITIPPIYFNEDSFVNRKDEKIVALTKKIVGNEQHVSSIISSLYKHTISFLSYENPIDGLYPYSQALTNKQTDCGGYSTFLSSCLQSLGIPTRLVLGFVFTPRFYSSLPFITYSLRNFFMHAWLEVMLPDSSWFPLDPSVEWRRSNGFSKRQGGFGTFPADRLVVSKGHNLTLPAKVKTYHFDIIQKPLYI